MAASLALSASILSDTAPVIGLRAAEAAGPNPGIALAARVAPLKRALFMGSLIFSGKSCAAPKVETFNAFLSAPPMPYPGTSSTFPPACIVCACVIKVSSIWFKSMADKLYLRIMLDIISLEFGESNCTEAIINACISSGETLCSIGLADPTIPPSALPSLERRSAPA